MLSATDTWSTSDVEPARAFEYWRDLICDTFVQLSATPTTDDQFGGRITHTNFGGFDMSKVRAGGQRVRRTPALIARDTQDYLLASIQTAGRGLVEQDGRVADLGPGCMAFYDSTRPYTLQFDAQFEQIVVQVPKQMVLSSGTVRHPELATAVALPRHGAAGVVAEFFRSLSVAQQFDPVGTRALADLGTGLFESALGLAAGSSSTAAAGAVLQREQVISHVRHHLGDVGLDAEAIASACHLSRRTLFRLFEGEGDGLAGLIRRLRIERAQQLLQRFPARSVQAVGRACGFAGEAQFHRAFRAVTDLTPATYRSAALKGAGDDGR